MIITIPRGEMSPSFPGKSAQNFPLLRVGFPGETFGDAGTERLEPILLENPVRAVFAAIESSESGKKMEIAENKE